MFVHCTPRTPGGFGAGLLNHGVPASLNNVRMTGDMAPFDGTDDGIGGGIADANFGLPITPTVTMTLNNARITGNFAFGRRRRDLQRRVQRTRDRRADSGHSDRDPIVQLRVDGQPDRRLHRLSNTSAHVMCPTAASRRGGRAPRPRGYAYNTFSLRVVPSSAQSVE